MTLPVPSPMTIGSAAVRLVLTSTLPLTPAAPGWMCAAMAGGAGGEPVSCIANVTVPPPVTAPLLSRGTLNVMRGVAAAVRFRVGRRPALRWPGSACAVKTIGPVVDGPVGGSSVVAPGDQRQDDQQESYSSHCDSLPVKRPAGGGAGG